MTGVCTVKRNIAAAIALGCVLCGESAAKKYIFTGWDLNDAGPEDILLHADKFASAGCDGIGVKLDPSRSEKVRERLHPAELPLWSGFDVEPIKKACRELVKHPGLRHSFFAVNFAPRKERLGWADDSAWKVFAENVSMAAATAKDVGFEGLIADFEDYYRKKQFRHLPGDPAWEKSKALARRRGREVFSGIFSAYPDITILAFQLLTTDMAYARVPDPVAYMESKRDLWPSFVNGILDAMPPGAKIVDGNESFGYGSKASRCDFFKSVRHQTVGVMPLVAPENRAKYRAQLSVSHGLYVDSYASCPTNSGYYMGPVRGKRITHFEDNLRQATDCSDEYVWFWGEKGFYVDWPADLKERSGNRWRSSGIGTWRRKYFEGSWGRIKPWRETLDGNMDLLLLGVKDPSLCVRREYARQIADGSFTDLFAGRLSPHDGSVTGAACARVRKMETDGWYGMIVKGRGESLAGDVFFQCRGSWRWNLGSFRFGFDAVPDKDGWREGVALVRIPDGADGVYVKLSSGSGESVKNAKVEFSDLKIFRIK